MDWRDDGRAKGRLKAAGISVAGVRLGVVVRGWPKLGMPLVRRDDMTEALLEGGLVGADDDDDVKGVLERIREARDDFFCSVVAAAATCGGGRPIEEMEGFLRSCSVEAGVRSCDWLAEGLSTGRRDDAGLGMPDGRGMDEAGSMVEAKLANRDGGPRWRDP